MLILKSNIDIIDVKSWKNQKPLNYENDKVRYNNTNQVIKII